MNPTIVLMLKAPVPGMVKTRLARDLGNERATGIYRQLVERQLSQLPDHWPVEIHFSPADQGAAMESWVGPGYSYVPQSDGDLGDRLVHSARSVFGPGASRLVFLGGDCPSVTTGLLESCAEELERHDIVIGPALDGGYYLIALRQPELEVFKGIEWGTDRVLAQTIERIQKKNLTWFELPILEDVDDLESWERCKGLLGQGSATA